MTTRPAVSVLMPCYEQHAFIARALDSLRAQSLTDWEAVIVDTSHSNATEQALQPWLQDGRIRYHRIAEAGLGRALNVALQHAQAPLVAYLPCDDVIYRDHLAQLKALLDAQPQTLLAYSGVRHHYNREVPGAAPGEALQLVQVMHRKVDRAWVEREELESDDLERLYWSRLRELGTFAGTGEVTCEWVDHPAQRHKLMREPIGGINPFRQHYRVTVPLRFHTTVGNLMDEPAQYRRYRERPATPKAADGLKILLVGELAYNADRVLALEEQGHQLYGLWMEQPYWYNAVGPLAFGHVQDLPRDHWQQALRELQPDVIYALLNWQAVPFSHAVMQEAQRLGIPFVWHFKEGPFICMEKGTWPQLVDLHARADGQIFSSPEMRDWWDTVVPELSKRIPTHVLDGDLPKRDWFQHERSPRLSEQDGEIHTVVPGRPIGLHPPDVEALARNGVHLHFYGDFTHGQWKEWIEKTRRLAPKHLHLHANVDQSRWVQEFSQYDAGWLHAFRSRNAGEWRRANWDDLNYPARMATLAAAGLPMIQQRNDGAVVATQTLVRELDLGLFFDTHEDLAAQLRDTARMQQLRERVWAERARFTFDHHVPALLAFFRQVIAQRASR